MRYPRSSNRCSFISCTARMPRWPIRPWPSTLKVFVLDEAWRFLRDPPIQRYLTEALKTWRKKNACVLLATQSSEDLERSDLLRVAIESCPTKCFLANPNIDRAVYQALFHLNDTEAERIATLVPRQQVLLKQPDVAKVLTLDCRIPRARRLFSATSVQLRAEPTRLAPHPRRPVPGELQEEHPYDRTRVSAARRLGLRRKRSVSDQSRPRRTRGTTAPSPTSRTVAYHARDLVALRAKVRYTTLIVLPQGEDDHRGDLRRQGVLDRQCARTTGVP